MRFRTKLLLWFLPPFFLLTASAGLYLFSPQIAEYALQSWLQKQNFSSVELNMQPPGWNELQIDNVSLIKKEEDKELRYNIRGLTLRFNPVEMFTLHKLNELLIREASVQIKYRNSPPSNQPDEFIDLKNTLPSQWFNQVPVDLLRVGELKLELDYPDDISDWQFIGAIHFTHQQLTSRVHFIRDERDLGWADLEVRDNDHFNLRVLESDQTVFVINGDLSFDQTLKLKSSQLLDINGALKWQRNFLGSEKTLPNISGSISTSGTTVFALQTQFSPDALLASIQTQQQFDAQLTVKDFIPEIGSSDVSLVGGFQFSDKSLALNLNHKTKVIADSLRLKLADKPISNLTFSLPQGLSIKTDLSPTLRGEGMTPVVSPTTIKLQTPDIAFKQGLLTATEILLKLQKVNLHTKTIEGDLSANNLDFTIPNQEIPKASVELSFNLKGSELNGKYSVNSSDLPLSLTGNFTSNVQSTRSKVDWTLAPIALKNIDRTLAPYLTIPPELSITAGTLFHKGSGKFKKGQFSAQAYNSIRSGIASWEDYQFEELNWDSKTSLTTSGKILDKGSVKLQRAKTGVDATGIETGYEFKFEPNAQWLNLKQTKAKLLQGTIRIAPLGFDPQQPDFETSVTVDKVDLGEVLSLEQQEGLSGEGKLSGSFPLIVKNGGITIKDGGLFSLDPGGKILFAPKPAVMAYAATNVGLKMALEALENFHFETLDIKLNYDKDGTAHLNTRLKGNNPDWNNGHPVDFTINIEENIPKLLQALQFTEKLTKTIEKRYR